MNYPTFLKKIDEIAAKCDANALHKFVHGLARTVPEQEREVFLARFRQYCGDSEEGSS